LNLRETAHNQEEDIPLHSFLIEIASLFMEDGVTHLSIPMFGAT